MLFKGFLNQTDPLIPVHTEEPCVVSLLHNHKGNTGLVILLQFDASLSDGQQLMLKNLKQMNEKHHKDTISRHSRAGR